MAQGRRHSERHALLVCSPGGHLLEMLALEPGWRDLDTTWVTLPAPAVDHLLADRPTIFAHGPTNRNLLNLGRNLALAVRVIRREHPEVILSTGAALAVPFFLVGKLAGCRLVYIESLTRTTSLSLSGRIVYPLASFFFVQWPGAASGRRKAIYTGSIL